MGLLGFYEFVDHHGKGRASGRKLLALGGGGSGNIIFLKCCGLSCWERWQTGLYVLEIGVLSLLYFGFLLSCGALSLGSVRSVEVGSLSFLGINSFPVVHVVFGELATFGSIESGTLAFTAA